MPEQVFKSPGFFDREIDLSARTVAPSGVPAGIVGASVRSSIRANYIGHFQ